MDLPILQDQYNAGYNKENDKLFIEVVMFALFAFVYSFIYMRVERRILFNH